MNTDMPPPSLVLPRRTGGLRKVAGDAGVQKTNDDAQSTKLSCAQLCYFKDDFLALLSKSVPSRKSPLINRGTWARHAVMKQATADFVAACVQQIQTKQPQQEVTQQQQRLDSNGSTPQHQQQDSVERQQQMMHPICQIVVLGAGSDSSWFNLRHQSWSILSAVRYIEIDYQEVVCKKARSILSSDKLLQQLPNGTTATTASPPTAAGEQASTASHSTWIKQASSSQEHALTPQQQGTQETQQQQQQQPSVNNSSTSSSSTSPPAAVVSHVQELTGPLYNLVSADIRNTQLMEAALQRAGFDPSLPTLYVSECVLIYLEPHEAQQVLAAAAARTRAAGSSAAVVIYEQTRPDDAFGATMISNLEARGCPLRSVTSVPSPAAQEQRLMQTGWQAAAAADMAAVYYGSSSSGWLRDHWQQERLRIERLELLDELEEWKLLQEHYVLAIGVFGDDNEGYLSEALRLKELRH